MSTSYDVRAVTYCILVPTMTISIVYISEKCSNSQIEKLSIKTVLSQSSPIIVHHAFLSNIWNNVIISFQVRRMKLKLIKCTNLELGFRNLSCLHVFKLDYIIIGYNKLVGYFSDRAIRFQNTDRTITKGEPCTTVHWGNTVSYYRAQK